MMSSQLVKNVVSENFRREASELDVTSSVVLISFEIVLMGQSISFVLFDQPTGECVIFCIKYPYANPELDQWTQRNFQNFSI